MARKKHRSQLDAIDQINMTPLIDLTFLLLIIFMITAPLLEYGIDVSPPEMNADQLPEERTLNVSIDRNGQIICERVKQSREQLLRLLERLHESSPDASILIRADGSRPYHEVMDLMRLVKNAGFSKVSLVTQAEGNG